MGTGADVIKQLQTSRIDKLPSQQPVAPLNIPNGDPNVDSTNPFANGKLAKGPSVQDILGMGTRAVAKGLGQVVDLGMEAANPGLGIVKGIDSIQSKYTGQKLDQTPSYEDYADKGSNAVGLANPLTDTEKLGSSAVTGATQFAVGPEVGLEKVLVNAAAGAGAGLAQEEVKQAGGGALSQTAAGLVAGALGLATGHIATKFGAPVAEVVANNAEHDIIREDGTLTDKGVQTGVDPKTIKKAYEEANTISEAHINHHIEQISKAKDEAIAAGLAEDHPSVVEADKTIQQLNDVKAKDAAPTETYQDNAGPDIRTPEQRQAEANDVLGRDTTKGFANQDVHQVAKEQDLARVDTPQGREAANELGNLKQAATDATKALQEGNDYSHMNTAEKGSFIQDTFNQAKTAAYDHVKDLFKKLDASQAAPKVVADKVKQHMLDVINTYSTPDSIRKALEQIAAQYGWVGKKIGKNEFGHDLVQVDKTTVNPEGVVENRPSHVIPVVGGTKQLTLANAHELDRQLNELYKAGESNPQLGIKKTLHDAVDHTLSYYGEAESKPALEAKAAQKAYREYKQAYDNKDIIQSITDVKQGTDTPKVAPENIPDKIIGTNPKDVSNLKKAKARLIIGQGKDAWEVIKAHTISKIIEGAIDTQTGLVNARKLNTAIAKLGKDKLKIIFEPSEYNQIMKLQRVVNDMSLKGQSATLRETNHLLRILFHATKWGSLIFGHGATHAASIAMFAGSDIAKRGTAAKEAMKTLDEIKSNLGTAKDMPNKPIVHPDKIHNLVKYLQSTEFSAPLLRGALSNKGDNDK